MMEQYAFRMRNVKKSFSTFSLEIEGLQLERGYVLGLIGQNGAGKSTTIGTLLNLIYPDSGSIEVLGKRQPGAENEIKRQVGYVSESPSFYEEMTVGWLIRFVGRCYPTWDDDLCRSYLQSFQLDPGKKVRELSKGMKVKLALLLALSHRPELLILDEPTSGIDPVVRRELLREIAGIVRDEKRSVLFSSHITQDVEQIADYIAIIESGRLIDFCSKEELFDRWKRIACPLPPKASNIDEMFVAAEVRDGTFVGITNQFSKDLINRLAAVGVTSPRVMRVSLDDILLAVVGKESW